MLAYLSAVGKYEFLIASLKLDRKKSPNVPEFPFIILKGISDS